MSFLLFEKDKVIRDGLSPIPLGELDWSDFRNETLPLRLIEQSDLVIISEGFEYFILKDRKYNINKVIDESELLVRVSEYFVDKGKEYESNQ